MDRVTKQFIEQLKVGDSVEFYLGWVRGTIKSYEIDAPKEKMHPAAHFEITPDWAGFEDVVVEGDLIEDDEIHLRVPLDKTAYARFTMRRVRTERP
jgi:hypothetical protein